jgi:hypothetical protein
MPFKLIGGLPDSQFKNNYSTEMCSSSEAGSYLRLIDFVCHLALALRVIQKKKKIGERKQTKSEVALSHAWIASGRVFMIDTRAQRK